MPISTDRGLAGALQVSASTIAADRKRIALSAKDFTVKPAAPVGNPSPDEQPRLGHDNITRCLRQRPPPGADPVTTATTAPSTRRVIRDLDDLKQAVMAAYEADQTASVDEL